MFDTFFGLPMHPLIVHATEVIVPTAAVVVVLAALWPRFRRWAGFVPLGLALAALVLVPLSIESGQSLEERVAESQLVQTHVNLADGLLPWVIGLVVVAVGLLWWNHRESRQSRSPRWIAITLIAAALLAGTGTTIQAIRIGHSGAAAVWSDSVARQSGNQN
ncbi:hypothetical protein E3O19_17515 [Cryobacterium algoritolerans]|uniref:DUF2231 domain-containing protein n=1 Tax=Cryobacterium algoritolerans TaxID=1259184 RepID=A0A4R8WJM4_9MICO|nr:DUF2231 domain-containing protein [Cryobacterium algoritolerans]TFC08961.1 hypothetical protein E3O19_17515 [Cryobacterium algoritolerans]